MTNGAIAGSVGECFKHYLEAQGSDSCRLTAAGFAPGKVKKWRSTLPKGMPFWELGYFLKNEGYDVTEIDSLPPTISNFGKLIFDRRMSVSHVCEEYPHIFTSRDALHDLFRRPHKRGRRTLDDLDAICNEMRMRQFSELESDMVSVQGLGDIQSCTDVVSKIPVVKKEAVVKVDKLAVLASFASLVDATMPIAQLLQSDQFSADDRYTLRVSLLPHGKLSRFADAINSLTSEHAREAHQKQQKKQTIKQTERT